MPDTSDHSVLCSCPHPILIFIPMHWHIILHLRLQMEWRQNGARSTHWTHAQNSPSEGGGGGGKVRGASGVAEEGEQASVRDATRVQTGHSHRFLLLFEGSAQPH